MSENIYLENFKKDAAKLLAEAGWEEHGGLGAKDIATDQTGDVVSDGESLASQYADLAAHIINLLMQFDSALEGKNLPKNSQLVRMHNNLEKMDKALNGYGADAWEANM